MKTIRTLILSSFALMPLGLVAEQNASSAKLKVGDPAPALSTGEWLKGEPVKKFEKGTVYLVEFGRHGAVPA